MVRTLAWRSDMHTLAAAAIYRSDCRVAVRRDHACIGHRPCLIEQRLRLRAVADHFEVLERIVHPRVKSSATGTRCAVVSTVPR
jgi:hypothetical protein